MVNYPEDWKEYRLDKIALINPPSKVPPIFKYVDLESVKGVSLLHVQNLDKEKAPSRAQRYAKAGDIFFQTVRPYQRNNYFFEIANGDYVFSSGYAQIRTDNNPKFLFYVLQQDAFVAEVMSRCTGTSYPAINPKHLGSIKVCIPESKSEQTAIATALSDMDALIDGLRRLITKKKNIRQGAMQELLTGKRRLPGFDGEWDNIIFDDCFDFLTNNTLSRAKLNYDSGTVKNIHYGDILVKFPFILDCHTEILPYINDGERLNLSVLRNGDILLADTAEDEIVGKAVELINIGEQRILAGLHTLPCRPKKYDMFASMWLGYYINSDAFHNQILPFVTGIKVASISKTAISKTVVSVPSKEEQAKIVEILYHMDEEISSLEYKLKKYENIKSGMMDKLLTGQIRLV